MSGIPWVKEFPGVITVCDTQGVVLEMNDASVKTFAKDGGASLLGTNLIDCHPEPSRTKLVQMLATQTANVYTVEKNGAKKLVYQVPWTEDGVYRGFVEIMLPLPDPLPHQIHDA